MNNNFLPSADTLKLREFLKLQQPDAELSWLLIEHETDIKMDAKGRIKFRSALRSEGIEYAAMPDYGIVLAGPKTGSRIVEHRVHKAKKSITTAHDSHKAISNNFLSEMSDEDQKKIVFIGAVFSAMEMASKGLHKIMDTPKPKPFIPQLPV